jgi:hypothetical protein
LLQLTILAALKLTRANAQNIIFVAKIWEKKLNIINARLYSKVWPMLSIFDSNKQKTPLEISVVFDRWGAVL